MKDIRLGWPLLGELAHSRPVRPVALTSVPKRFEPVSFDLRSGGLERLRVGRHCVVRVWSDTRPMAEKAGGLTADTPAQTRDTC